MALHRDFLSPVKFERAALTSGSLTRGTNRKVSHSRGCSASATLQGPQACCLSALSLVHLALNKVPVACPLLLQMDALFLAHAKTESPHYRSDSATSLPET